MSAFVGAVQQLCGILFQPVLIRHTGPVGAELEEAPRYGFSTGAYFPVSRGVQPVLWLRLGVCCCQGLSGYYCGRGQASTISKARKTESRGEVLGKGAARESGSAVSSPSWVLGRGHSRQTVFFLHYTVKPIFSRTLYFANFASLASSQK